ncbi:zinc finger protein 227-like, partial [Stegodyphus dumicola]
IRLCSPCYYLCNYYFFLIFPENVTRHSVRIHTCSYCSYSSPYGTNLKVHLRVHTGERPYICEICGKGFTKKQSLQQHHTSVHSGERPFKCFVCTKSFTQKHVLKSHMLTHSLGALYRKRPEASATTKAILESSFRAEDQVYACHFCDYTTYHKVNFESHIITHTGERPFVCSICNKGFTQKHNLQYHFMIHRGLKPYVCEVCNQGFRRSYCLKLHKEKHGH